MPFACRSQFYRQRKETPNLPIRSGLTLIEILIALTMTLIVLGAMMTAFKFASEEMQQGRALMELSNRARSVEDYLRLDLSSVTVEPRVYTGATEPNGYFEYIEGPVRDSGLDSPGNANPVNSYLGDCDDILAMTIRSRDGVLFRGRSKQINGSGPMTLAGPTIIESSLAEVVWFTTVNDNEDLAVGLDKGGLLAPQSTTTVDFDDSVRVHRRVLLIRPDLAGAGLPNGQLANDLSSLDEAYNFIRNNDISLRIEQDPISGGIDLFANSLQDLAVRKNRFAHTPDSTTTVNFPNNLTFANIQNRMASDDDVNNEYEVDPAVRVWTPHSPLLTDVAAFDLKVYSPNAAVNIDTTANIVVEPGDQGYVETDGTVDNGNTPADLQTLGAYVDLGYSPTRAAARPNEWFIGVPSVVTGYSSGFEGNVWDTWTPLYERDSTNQDNDTDSASNPLIDEGSNGVDNGGSPVIDDPQERETVAPYAQPIRGLKVTLRLVEKGTKQVHQTSVIQSFVPE